MNADRSRVRSRDGEPRRNPKKSDALSQPANRDPVAAGFQWDGNRQEDHRQREMDGGSGTALRQPHQSQVKRREENRHPRQQVVVMRILQDRIERKSRKRSVSQRKKNLSN